MVAMEGIKTLGPLTPEIVFPGEKTDMKSMMADTPAEPRSFSSSLLPLSGIVVQNFQRPGSLSRPILKFVTELRAERTRDSLGG